MTEQTPNGYAARIAYLEEQAREGRASKGNSLGVMASWAGVLVAVLGGVGAIVASGIERELDQGEVARKELDASVQREMRDLDATLIAMIEAARAEGSARSQENARRITSLEDWQGPHTADGLNRDSMMSEQIRALEREVFAEQNDSAAPSFSPK